MSWSQNKNKFKKPKRKKKKFFLPFTDKCTYIWWAPPHNTDYLAASQPLQKSHTSLQNQTNMESLILLWNDLVVFRTELVWDNQEQGKKHKKTGRGKKLNEREASTRFSWDWARVIKYCWCCHGDVLIYSCKGGSAHWPHSLVNNSLQIQESGGGTKNSDAPDNTTLIWFFHFLISHFFPKKTPPPTYHAYPLILFSFHSLAAT